jgi:hypothetical protein
MLYLLQFLPVLHFVLTTSNLMLHLQQHYGIKQSQLHNNDTNDNVDNVMRANVYFISMSKPMISGRET